MGIQFQGNVREPQELTEKEGEFIQAGTIAQIIIVSCNFCLFMFVLISASFEYFRGGHSYDKTFGKQADLIARDSLFWIIIFCMVSVITVFANLTGPFLSFTDESWILNDTLCTVVVPKIYAPLFGIAHWCMYEFLWARNKLVEIKVYRQWLYRYLQLLSYLLMKFLPILLPILCVLFWNQKVVLVDGTYYCISVGVWQLAITFAVLDPLLAFTFMLQFIWPILEHRERMRDIKISSSILDTTDVLMMRTIRKTAFFALCGIFFTIFAMSMFAVRALIFENFAIAAIVKLVMANTDLAVNLVCICKITNIWMTPSVKRLFRIRDSGSLSSNNKKSVPIIVSGDDDVKEGSRTIVPVQE